MTERERVAQLHESIKAYEAQLRYAEDQADMKKYGRAVVEAEAKIAEAVDELAELKEAFLLGPRRVSEFRRKIAKARRQLKAIRHGRQIAKLRRLAAELAVLKAGVE